MTPASSDLALSLSMPAPSAASLHEASVTQRAFLPAPPTGPPPDRRSKSYTPDQVQDSNKREEQKEEKKEKKDRRSKTYTQDTVEASRKEEEKEEKKEKKDRRSKSYTSEQVAEGTKKEEEKVRAFRHHYRPF